ARARDPRRRRHGALHHRAGAAAHPRPADRRRRPAGGGALRRLRPVGLLLPDPEAPAGREMVRGRVLVPAVHRGQRDGSQLLRGGPDPRNHDPADRLRDLARGDPDRPARAQGGGARARRDALGDDPHGGAAVCARRHRGRRDARTRPRDRRDDRGDARDRQRAGDRPHGLPAGLHARGGDRERVRRGGVRSAAPRGADRRRARAVRADAGRQRGRARVRPARRARGDVARRRPACGRRRAKRRLPDADMSAVAFAPISARRRRVDKLARGGVALLTGVALVPLALILYYLLKQGLGAISLSFFTTDPTGSFLGDPGGIKSAIVGTLLMVGLATAVAVPVGVGVAIWLVEFGRVSKLAHAVRYFIDVMTGVPSIVFGLFVYITLVLGGVGGSSFAGWKGSTALALLMLPIVTRSAEVVLQLVPNSLREAAYALGAPRWKTVLRVVLPTALPGIVTGVLLAIARAAGETAPLLFT